MGDNYFNFSLTTFNRSGRLLQIEYALNAVRNGCVEGPGPGPIPYSHRSKVTHALPPYAPTPTAS